MKDKNLYMDTRTLFNLMDSARIKIEESEDLTDEEKSVIHTAMMTWYTIIVELPDISDKIDALTLAKKESMDLQNQARNN